MTPAERRQLTPAERLLHQKLSLAGQVGANSRIADPAYDGQAATRAATTARQAKLEKAVDPDGQLDPAKRARKAAALRKAQLAAGRLAKLQGKRGKGR